VSTTAGPQVGGLSLVGSLQLILSQLPSKLHNEELHNLYSSPSVIRMPKSRWMVWAGHTARMGRRMRIKLWWESQKESDH
jgi:hypothetical protein